MNADQLKRLAGKEGIPFGTIEKDYALTIILSRLGQQGFARDLFFKGGTAIKKIYFHDTRFSEDLDFTCQSTEAPKKLLQWLEKEITGKQIECIKFGEIKENEETTKSAKIRLAYSETSGHQTSIKFDLSLREQVLLPSQTTELLEEYDQPASKILPMDLTEIMAEKIRALLTRKLPRDLYDVWFLAKRHVSIDATIVEQKLSYYGRKLDAQQINQVIQETRANWKTDLERLLPKTPEYSEVVRETIQVFTKNRWFDMIAPIEIKEIDAGHVEKVNDFASAQAFYVTLTGEPHPEWTAILKNLHDNWIYLLRRRIAVQGNKIMMVFGDENEIAPHIDHLKKLLKETNDRASRVNQTRVEQQKRTQKIELDRLLEAEKAKKKLRKINAGLQTGTP
ncbi:MAG TPA: nucleotidyl transferase AbiEii/AbiGii toxin family protein [Candidatus Diapherotrites archaeon]|uniref:Nucleotidyl transferase AbiEii/AbiGii toxin family protein n=1 Tax=Candidatus Iainarchaeum sp. TaxID=3101447 RepID=A0A7J4JFW4_9ARCH|nr:nucleotidyl transferase AbiEii/AbiGii toxin family protein [Candidatus Diapherotrites archaeon]